MASHQWLVGASRWRLSIYIRKIARLWPLLAAGSVGLPLLPGHFVPNVVAGAVVISMGRCNTFPGRKGEVQA